MNDGLKFFDATTAHPSQMTGRQLIDEENRLVGLLQKNELTPKDGRRLQKIRDALLELVVMETGI
jgi:phosphoenolpyruvate carboxylase